MTEPVWITERMAAGLHAMVMAQFGGGDTGILDENGFGAALTRPRNKWAYEEGLDLFDYAAAYAFGIVKGHVFRNGNKRTGHLVADVFLRMNGFTPTGIDEAATYGMIVSVASGEAGERELAAFYRSMYGRSL